MKKLKKTLIRSSMFVLLVASVTWVIWLVGALAQHIFVDHKAVGLLSTSHIDSEFIKIKE